MKEPDIFDDMIEVLRRQSETTGGRVYVSPEVRKTFWAASARPGNIADVHSAAPAPVNKTAPTPQPSTNPVAPSPAPVPSTAAPAVGGAAKLNGCSLDELQALVHDCRNCGLCEGRTHTVFGAGNPHAELMFIGEGPGRDEDLQGEPFVGAAGQLLTKMITAMQFDRATEVYIANIVKCRPPGNRNPEPDEAGACLPYLRRQIELIHPKVIILLGAVPLKYVLGKTSITRERGHWDEYRGIRVMPTYHPAYLLRYEAGKKEAWADLQEVMKVFGKVYRHR